MFFVSDSQEFKQRKVRAYLQKEPMIAVLLAAANFEWTVGRCILIMSQLPNVEVRERLIRCSGTGKYAQLWNKELVTQDPTIPPLNQIVQHWTRFEYAFQLRHKLIHGRDTCTRKMAAEPAETLLAATSDLYRFAESRNKELNNRLPNRPRKRKG